MARQRWLRVTLACKPCQTRATARAGPCAEQIPARLAARTHEARAARSKKRRAPQVISVPGSAAGPARQRRHAERDALCAVLERPSVVPDRKVASSSIACPSARRRANAERRKRRVSQAHRADARSTRSALEKKDAHRGRIPLTRVSAQSES